MSLGRETGLNGPMDSQAPLIAIVDDEVSICRALLRLLRVANYRAESFNSPILFLESLAEHVPDCVVLDLQMPMMTGVELQEHLQRLADPPPVIIITAHDEPKTRERCLALGAVRYLRKPIEGDILMCSIEEAVRARRTGRAGSRGGVADRR
ncbi:MAG TPA: response regulator [Gammaproteobacteria bacterium]